MYNKKLQLWMNKTYDLVKAKDKVGNLCNDLYKSHGIRILQYNKETASKWNKHLVVRKWATGSAAVKRSILQSLCDSGLIIRVDGLPLTKSQMAKVSSWMTLFITTNYKNEILCKHHFVLMVSGPSGSGKTWAIRDMLDRDEKWCPVWIDTDQMNLKNNYDKIFCNSTFSNKNVYASMFSTEKDTSFKMYVLDDMEVITNKNAIAYITKTMLNTHISRMTEKVWMSQKNSVPLIIICTNPNSTAMHKLMLRLKGLDAYISWPRPTASQLQKVAMKKYNVPMIKACLLAKRAFGDFRVLENMILYSSSESDMLEDCDETFRRIHIGYSYDVNNPELCNKKLYDNIVHAWPKYISYSGNYEEMPEFISDLDLITSEKNDIVWEYKNLLPIKFVLSKKNTTAWNEDDYFDTLSKGRSNDMKLRMRKYYKTKDNTKDRTKKVGTLEDFISTNKELT